MTSEDTIFYAGKKLHLLVVLEHQEYDKHLDEAQAYLDDARERGLTAACTHRRDHTRVYRERRP